MALTIGTATAKRGEIAYGEYFLVQHPVGGADAQPRSELSTLATSVWSRVVTITGVIDNRSGTSRIEVALIRNGATFGSVSSTSLA